MSPRDNTSRSLDQLMARWIVDTSEYVPKDAGLERPLDSACGEALHSMFVLKFGLKKNPFREPRWDIAGRAGIAAAPRQSLFSPVVKETVEKACVYCGSAIIASPRTLAANCPGCGQHVTLQDLTLTGDVTAERTATAGNITVTRDARISGDLLATHINIHGRVLGNIAASEECIVHPTGKVAGQIICRKITVEPGAALEGSIQRINE